MSTQLQIRGIMILLIATSAVLLIVIVFYMQEQIKQATTIVTDERIITVTQIANILERQFSDTIKILQVTSKNHHVKDPPLTSAIDYKLHGIPENLDTDRRKVMRDTVESYDDLDSVRFILPNGDMYIGEPFFLQKNSTVSNFAFREWYKDVISSHNIAISQVITSKLTGKPNIVIALPVFSQSGEVQGILAGSLNADKIQEDLKSLQSYVSERILIVDDTQIIVADSKETLRGHKFSTLAEIQEIVAGKSGTGTDIINGTKMFIAHSPVKIGQTTWTVISIQPYDDAFHSINVSIQESWVLAILIIVIVSISNYYINNIFQRRVKLSKELEQSNESLKRTQDSLIASEERYRNLFQLAPDPILVTDMNEFVLSCNESFERKFGYSKDEIIGKNLHDFVHETSKDDLVKCHDELKISSHLYDKEMRYVKKDGTSLSTLLSIGILRDKNNVSTGYVAIITDVTEINKAKKKIEENEKIIKSQLEALQEVDKLKDEFASMISHELKTPLFPIKFHSEMLLDESLKGVLSKTQLESVKEIHQNAERLEWLISDMLTVQKVELKKLTYVMSDVDIERYIDEVMKTNAPLMMKKQIEFVNSNTEKITIRSDPARLSQVFGNLIKNSVDFVPDKGGRIEVGAQDNKEDVVFYVKDNGIGIAPEKQQNLFKKFYQVDTSYKRNHGGSGLGLAICKGIVEDFGGKIWVESEAGKGATFYFTIPKRSN